MAQMEKYLFENSFDVEPPPAPAEEEPEPNLYSEEQLAAAQSEGFAKGRTEGEESALQGIEQTTAQALSAIAARLETAAAQLAEVNERREHQSLQAAVTILRKLFPELARRHGLEEIEATIASCLERLHDEPRVVIRTADGLADRLCQRIDPLAEACGFEGKVVLLPDPELSPSDVRIEWADGGAERDTGRLWDEVDQILADSLSHLSAESDPAADPASPRQAAAEDEAVAVEPTAGDRTTAVELDDPAVVEPAALDEAAADSGAAVPATEDGAAAEAATLTEPSETGAQ